MYQDRKGKYHKKPKYAKVQNRKSCNGIYIKDDKFLLIKPKWSTLWEFPGGGKEKNETLVEALKREFLEETGFKITKLNKKPIHKINTKFYADDMDIYFNSTIYFFKIIEAKEEKDYIVDKKEIKKISYLNKESLNKNNTKLIHLNFLKQ